MTARNVLIVGVVCFLIGALSPLYPEDIGPTWVFTWLGLVLIVVGAVLWAVRRRGSA